MHKAPIILCVLTLILLGLFSLVPSKKDFLVPSLERKIDLFSQYSPPEVRRQVESQLPDDAAFPDAAFPDAKTTMQLVVSIVMLACGIFIILSRRYGPKDTHWAYGIIGTIVGYWLRG